MFATRNLWTSVLLWVIPGCWWVAGMFLSQQPVWICVTHAILTGLLLILLNQTVEHYALTANLCNFPVVFFLLVQAGSIPLYGQYIASAAAILCLLGCRQLFDCYQMNNCNVQTFNAFFLFALASLLIPPLVWLLPVLWVGYNIINKLSLRRFLSSLVGIALVAWMTWGVLFLLDKTALVSSYFGQIVDGFDPAGFLHLSESFVGNVWWRIAMGMYVLVAFVSIVSFWRKEGSRRSVRNDTVLLHVVWLALMALMICFPVHSMNLLLLSAVPFSIAAGQLYFERDTLFTRILFVGFLISLLASFFSMLF